MFFYAILFTVRQLRFIGFIFETRELRARGTFIKNISKIINIRILLKHCVGLVVKIAL